MPLSSPGEHIPGLEYRRDITNPNGTLTSPLFGQISGSANARIIIQFALNYNF
jgi:hypothetical protein